MSMIFNYIFHLHQMVGRPNPFYFSFYFHQLNIYLFTIIKEEKNSYNNLKVMQDKELQ